MKTLEINILNQKAKTKKDGVYSYNGNLYAVKNAKFIAYFNSFGECYQRMGAFNVLLGNVEVYDRRKELNKIIKSYR